MPVSHWEHIKTIGGAGIIHKNEIIILFIGLVFLLSAVPAAADPVEDNFRQIQESLSLMEQYNGTEMTTAEYLETVWPQVYAKVSQEKREHLATFSHVWELKPLHENGTGLGFGLTDKWGPERFALMDAIRNLAITEGEYQAIAQTELYLDAPESGRKMLSGMIRMQRENSTAGREYAVSEGETLWFSKQVFANVSRLSVHLRWTNPAESDNILSLTIYSPDKCVFGPYAAADFVYGTLRGKEIRTTIARPGGVAEGEWWYCVKGVKVNESQKFTI